MRILYIAKHNSGDNDDEGAITHALVELGHTVTRVDERKGFIALRMIAADFDWCLFHKWEDYASIEALQIKKAFWYFDLVQSDDTDLKEHRNAVRMDWMAKVTPLIDVGFCTDGDWVNQDQSGKLVHLMQGVDERTAGYGQRMSEKQPPLLFTGLANNGVRRRTFVEALEAKYGDRFQSVGNKTKRVHGIALANLFTSVKIVIAPDGPNTDNYWSNRVYLTLGHGGFLLHPYCEKLKEHYTSGNHLVMYRSMDELCDLVEYYLDQERRRRIIQHDGMIHTLKYHLYRHRVMELIDILEDRS